MKRSSGPRKTANLSASINQQLNGYVLAASAGGVALLALAQPGEAKIIYTQAHARVVFGQPLPVDLNRDGIVDFYLMQQGDSGLDKLSACQYWASFISSIACSSSRGTNAIRTSVDSKGRKFGAALRYGEKIQRGEQFAKRKVTLGTVVSGFGSDTTWRGPWLNGGKGVKNRYLGLKFKIKGWFHFGWARITVTTTSNNFTATLTGYAYETIPGKSIIAGQTKESGEIGSVEQPVTVPTPEPATLGLLAMGAPGLSIWRRKESLLPGD
jgi:hypothetical protein